MSTSPLPKELGAVTIPKFLSPSRFGELMNCRLSVLAPAQSTGVLPTSPVSVLGSVLHHVVREVGEGRWGDAPTASTAFGRVLAQALSDQPPTPVPLDVAVGRQRWHTRIARARAWAIQDAPERGTGEPRRLGSFNAKAEAPVHPRVDIGHEAWIVWPDGRLRGRADRVESHREKIRVTENKSGAIYDRNGSLVEGIAVQVGLYALAIESLTSKQVETVVRQDAAVVVPWDDAARKRIRGLLDQQLAGLQEAAVLGASDLATPGASCRRCTFRTVCSKYLSEAPHLWLSPATSGRMPLDVWGTLRRLEEAPDAIRVELRDDVGRLVVVDELSRGWGLQDARIGDRIFFFDLEADEDRQHAERVQPSNFREGAPAKGSTRRRAYGLRVFRAT